ncbi:MAG: hypothetical protein LBB27_04275 [Tannerellaceae bacterium]|jgi:abortive infection bacteriophage resistance protein|nr:hypothetical protein [Tannerellaceae bacterium]
MEYTKRPISIEEQIKKLKSRGLVIEDEEAAASCLTVISYYRLRAYSYPFQENKDKTQDDCAHHSRIWNKHFPINIKLPYNPLRDFLDEETRTTIDGDRLFVLLCCIQYLSGCIDTRNGFAQDLQRIRFDLTI